MDPTIDRLEYIIFILPIIFSGNSFYFLLLFLKLALVPALCAGRLLIMRDLYKATKICMPHLK